jgi:cell division protein FtsI (penicillin-binding protein 3)
VAEMHGDTWRLTMQRRMVCLAVVALLWSGLIQGRLVQLQLFQRAFLTAKANSQHSGRRPIPARRGEILDRHGRVLAYTVVADTVVADPKVIEDVPETIAGLCAVLTCTDRDRVTLAQRLSDKTRRWERVRRYVPPDLAERVMALALPGVRLEKEDRRYYPNRELAAHVVGYVGTDHNGLGGIEAAYDEVIKGQPGRMRVQTDANGAEFNARVEQEPTIGTTLELTIDERLQYIAERELRRGVRDNLATAGTAIILDPRTGEILAMASYPTFNPNVFGQVRADVRRNRAVQDTFEPGSTFKIVTASALIDQGIVHPEQVIDVSGGRISFGPNDVIRDTHDYKQLSFADVIVKSSNVGVIKVTSSLGPDRLTDYIRRFGFGRPASPRDFPGESRGIVWEPASLRESALARVAIGYQVSVTPLQMAAAMSSVANGGELLQPHVVRAFITDGTRHPVPRTVVNRTVSPAVADALTTIMEGVVERGTATQAAVPGYSVAGKTGTATRWADGRYVDGEHNASFVGFVPSRNPVFTILVVIDTPKGRNGYYGGPVAGPVFRRIAEAALGHAAVPRTFDPPPPLIVQRRTADLPQRQVSTPLPQPATASGLSDPLDEGVPDLTGLGARDALAALSRRQLSVRMYGSGLVVRQDPAPGAPAETGRRVSVWLERRAPEGSPSRLIASRHP